MKHLEGLTQVERLNLGGTRITDAGLERLKTLTQLQVLCLSSTLVTDGGLEHLNGLSHLQAVILNGIPITDAGLEHLKRLPELRVFEIVGTNVTDEGVQKLHGRCRSAIFRGSQGADLSTIIHPLLTGSVIINHGIVGRPAVEFHRAPDDPSIPDPGREPGLLASETARAEDACLRQNVRHYVHLPPDKQAAMRDMAGVLAAKRRWEGGAGFQVTEEMKLTIAGQASLLVLGLDQPYYFDRVPSIIVYERPYRHLASVQAVT